MAIKLPERNYFSMAELMLRWSCTDNDIRALLLSGKLVPSIRIWQNAFPGVEEADSEGATFFVCDRDPDDDLQSEWLSGYFYVHGIYERGPFEGEAHLVGANRHRPGIGARGSYLLASPDEYESKGVSLSEIMRSGVVMLAELARFEQELSTDSLSQADPQALLDPDADDYPELLHIAIRTWTHAREGTQGTPKQRALQFLEDRYKTLPQTTREAIALVVNWKREGGRPPKHLETGG